MDIKDVFKDKGNLKILLLAISLLLWVYFYSSSKASIAVLLSLNISNIAHSFISTNFLLFLLLFPLTSAIVVVLSTNKDKWVNFLQCLFGMGIGIIVSFLVFDLTKELIIFLNLFLISNLVVSLLVTSEYKETNKVSKVNRYVRPKLNVFLIISLFVSVLLTVSPAQVIYRQSFEDGFVGLFVSGDIQKVSSFPNNDSQVQQIAISEDQKEEMVSAIKSAIYSMPIFVLLLNHFALFSALFISIISAVYFLIFFSLLYTVFTLLFFKILGSNENKEMLS